MDTLTHIAVGATLGGLVMGRRAGLKPYLWGAVLANLPDIDAVFHSDSIGYLLIHRGITHSLFFQVLAVPLIVLLILALHRDQRPHALRWTLLVWLALATHSLLDAFNPYGAQLLAPFSNQAISFNAMYVVDPLFTLPLLAGLWLAWRWRGSWPRRALIGAASVSLAYLAFAGGAKLHVHDAVERELARQQLPVEAVMTMPMPFTTLLWRVLAVDEGGYYEGYYSLLDPEPMLDLRYRASEHELLAALENHVPVQQLRRFGKGFYQVEVEGGKVVMRDLRLGQGSYYPVSFIVGQLLDESLVIPRPDRRAPTVQPGRAEFIWLWQRIWNPAVAATPLPAP